MKITTYGGAGEIGGNKILLEADNTRIFLDFGEPFDRGQDIFFDSYMSPRARLGLKDYFEFGLLPQIKGLYSKDCLIETKLKHARSAFDGVLISHIHSDHCSDLQWLDPKIPVYMGHGAKQMLDMYAELPFGMDVHENTQVFKSNKKFKIKNLEIIPIHVDHSTPGAYGFVIKTSEGNILYTGDYRFHGFLPQMTRELIKIGEKEKIKLLITEGTRVTEKKAKDDVFKENITEQQVEDRLYDAIKACKGLVVVNFSARNIDRVRSLYRACKKAGRIMLGNPYTSYIIDNAGDLIGDMPKVKGNKYYKTYIKRKGRGFDWSESDYKPYEREYLKNALTYKDVKKSQDSYVMCISTTDLLELIDIQPVKGSQFIFSFSEHYLEEGDKQEGFDVWMEHFGMKFSHIHCSGHADEKGVREMINGVAPQIVMPVHTDCPERFKKFHNKVILPEINRLIKF